MQRKKCSCGRVLYADIDKCPSCGKMMAFINVSNEEFTSNANEDSCKNYPKDKPE